jgi:hypothetical protein
MVPNMTVSSFEVYCSIYSIFLKHAKLNISTKGFVFCFCDLFQNCIYTAQYYEVYVSNVDQFSFKFMP